ncbi:MAG: hypothetical protein MUE72_10585 [Chitinophagaceae bacterium]|jgi:hypothetical protein|nr:hypothetical protein [Chitinophagaceae bacterium]
MKKMMFIVWFGLTIHQGITQVANQKTSFLKSMYFQWGYNTEWYTKSNVHIKMSNGNNFTLHKVNAHDRPDLDAVLKKPLEISIPQYSYRIGFYLNKKQTKALEINFDHIKYIVKYGQTVKVTGIIDGVQVNGDSVINANSFLHFEHSDGGNLLHINYVEQRILAYTKHKQYKLLTWIWKAGAGINIPRTAFTWRGEELNNMFHIAGYNLSAESGFRIYLGKKFFFEFTGKTGFVQYINALANTPTLKGNRISHNFGYIELIGTFGFDINW